MKFLNLGCGARFHPAWVNLDVSPSDPSVQRHDLRKGIPYAAATFDCVYHSHVLEHFPRSDASRFLSECFRVLKPGGTVRVVVPDLESIARLYIEALDKASEGVPGWDSNYEWMVLELFDQTVRESSGGNWATYLQRDPIPNSEFVVARVGASAESLRRGLSGRPHRERRNYGRAARNRLLRLVLGPDDWNCLQVGRFRSGGEVHKWMYDRYSLGSLLSLTGFVEPEQTDAFESRIQDWTSFGLDTDPDGSVYKPDSLFMEAWKP